MTSHKLHGVLIQQRLKQLVHADVKQLLIPAQNWLFFIFFTLGGGGGGGGVSQPNVDKLFPSLMTNTQ